MRHRTIPTPTVRLSMSTARKTITRPTLQRRLSAKTARKTTTTPTHQRRHSAKTSLKTITRPTLQRRLSAKTARKTTTTPKHQRRHSVKTSQKTRPTHRRTQSSVTKASFRLNSKTDNSKKTLRHRATTRRWRRQRTMKRSSTKGRPT